MDPSPDSARLAAGGHQSGQMSWLGLTCCRVALWARRVGLVLALVGIAAVSFGADAGTPVSVTGKGDETNVQDTLRAYLQLQEQLHATQLAIERGRQDADAAATENARAFAARLQNIEQSLSAQRGQELDVMRSSNKAILFVAGLFAALGFVAMIFMAYFQWRTISRLAEISAAFPVAHAFGATPPISALGDSDGQLPGFGAAQQLDRLVADGVVEQNRAENAALGVEIVRQGPLHHCLGSHGCVRLIFALFPCAGNLFLARPSANDRELCDSKDC